MTLSLVLIVARNRLEGSLSKSGRNVSLGLAPAQLSLQGPEGVREIPSAGPVAQHEAEGGQDGVDDRPLRAEGHGDEPQHGHKKPRHQRGEQLGQDDGGEHHDKCWNELDDLVGVEFADLLGNEVADLLDMVDALLENGVSDPIRWCANDVADLVKALRANGVADLVEVEVDIVDSHNIANKV